MTQPVLMQFDETRPAGLPGALRSAAATFPVVFVGNALVLRIARDLEDVRQVRDDLMQERAVRQMYQDSVNRMAEQIGRYGRLKLWLGVALGVPLGAAIWAVLP